MGVHGLWQLLQSTGKTVPLDSLEGKVLAVDVSIWLHQAIKGMRDRDGNTLPNAHLQVLFNRICKLLYYRIKPVFVFDGGVPELKKQTLVSRRERKEFANQESERTSKKLLENLMRSRAVKEVLAGEAVKDDKLIKVNKNRAKDLYELPPLPKEFQSIAEETDYWEERKQTQQMIQEELENNADFDTTSEDFKSLPAELKHEILTEIQERTKRTPWTNLHELPEESDDFSSFQMKKLLKKGRLTHQLDHVRKEMLTRTTGAITPGLNDDYYSDNIQARRVVSSDTSHYVLIKGIGRKQQQELARKHLEENMNKEQETDNEKAEDTQNTEKVSDSDDKTDIEMSSKLKSKDLSEENKDNENLYKERKSNGKSDGEFESKEVIPTNKDCEVITINDDINEMCEQKSAITDDVINLSDSEEPKPSTSSGSTNIQPSFSGGHDIDLDSDSDDGNGGISQQEILAMIKNENKKTSKNVAESENRFSISDDSSEDSDVEIQPEPKVTKVSPKMISKGTGNVDIKKKSEEKIENKDLHNMETLITERKRRLSLEQEICIEPKKLKQVDDNETVMTIDDSSKNDLVGQESTKGDNSEITINEDESEDEGFIEVSIDPNKATPDDLFPEDIFVAPDKMATSALPVTNEQDKVSAESVGKPPAHDDKSPKQPTSDSTELNIPKKSASHDDEEEKDESSHLGHRDLAKDFEGLNEFDLQEWQDELEAESKTLKEEMNKQERLGASITDEMYIDAQGLLKIFGLPFITSPMEAEAQCAKLDELDLTQGTITDDSDVWLFGGKRVYKNFYQKDKHVEFYSNTSIQSQLGLNRSLLINIALLCGSDYTEGIQGVGPIKAMEIMTEFPGDGIHGLEYFRDWWEECQRQPKMPHEAKIRTQLRKLYVTPGFPSPSVVEAYLNPAVDDSKDPFSWSKPDLYQLREFATEKLGWSKAKIDEVLLPVMKRLNEQEFQSKINMYFQPENFIKPANVKSKRLQKALDKFTASPTKQKGEGQNDNRSEVKVTKKTKTKRTMEPNNDQDESSGNRDSNTGEYEKLVKLTCEIEDFKMKNNLDNSNLAKLQRVRERLGIKVPKVKMPKGKGQRGRGKGRGVVGNSSTSEISVSNPKPATKIKDEIDLSESSGSSGDELLANLDLDAMLENAESGEKEPQSSSSGQKMSGSSGKSKSGQKPGGFIIDDESSDSEQDRKCSKRNSGKGKGRGKGSSNKRGQSSKRGHSLTSSLRTTSSRTSKSRAESKISRLQLSENDSDSD